MTSGSSGLARRSVGGFDIFPLLASHHDSNLVVRGGSADRAIGGQAAFAQWILTGRRFEVSEWSAKQVKQALVVS
jgi:hypothetical protein